MRPTTLPQPAEDAVLQSLLLRRGRDVVTSVHRGLHDLRHQPDWDEVRRYLQNRTLASGRDTTLPDLEAESIACRELEKPYPGQRQISLLAIGEERMKRSEWKSRSGLQGLDPNRSIVALVDPLDGTKLEAREIPTWCIALVFYERQTGHVLAAAVGQATGSIYLATAVPVSAGQIDDGDPSRSDDSRTATAWRQVPNPQAPVRDGWFDLSPPEPLALPAAAAADQDRIHAAFVAQNPSAFVWAARFVQEAHTADQGLLARVYNMGGNPMLAKVADGTIDAVVGFGDFSADGPAPQMPHDYVPGAFIARQAGASVIDLDAGGPLDFESCLLTPDQRGQRYVVAATPLLAKRCLAAVRAAEAQH